MMFAGGQVNRVRILTSSNSLALYLSMRSKRVRLADFALEKPSGRSTASEMMNRPGW